MLTFRRQKKLYFFCFNAEITQTNVNRATAGLDTPAAHCLSTKLQGGSNMTGTICV
jgi:hypothetical protein